MKSLIVLFLATSAFAQTPQQQVGVTEEIAVEAAKVSKDLGGLALAIVPVDVNEAPILNSAATVVQAVNNGQNNSPPAAPVVKEESAYETSLVMGLPSLPGFRAQWKFWDGGVKLGGEVGSPAGMGLNGAIVADLAPLAQTRFNFLYSGYRLYLIKTLNDESENDNVRINAFVGGVKYKRAFFELGKARVKSFKKIGGSETEWMWLGSFGIVLHR